VSLSGKELGSLPIQNRKVPAGEHELVVRWSDGREVRYTVVVPAMGSVRQTVTLPQ